LDQVSGVITAQIKRGQRQVSIGATVAQVFEEASKLVSVSDNQVQSTDIKKTLLARVVAAISGCFGPVIRVLIGWGM
ncbi:PTS beta-glucoside transporter subunit EIIBCA, partial [Streptococcus suis]